MKQSVALITLGVADYERAKTFYDALGWTPLLEVQKTAFFQANGAVLVLWAREKLAEDMGIPDDGARWSGIVLAHNVGSREEVDDVISLARANGAEITRQPSETFYGGYAGGFRDLDGRAWEIAHNPTFDSQTTGASSFQRRSRTRLELGEKHHGSLQDLALPLELTHPSTQLVALVWGRRRDPY